jgi:3-hydroxyisobutyrate dehydrogenase-like beta-hydroxyacid dehydrogenase
MRAAAVGAGIAQALVQTGKPLYCLEANAISPMSSTAREATIVRAGGRSLDGCILGGPASLGSRGRLSLSGPDAEVVAAALRWRGLHVEGLGGRAGQASAFKMGYAGLTKGTTARLLELTLRAHAWGCLDALLAKYASSPPAAFRRFITHLTT